MLKPQVTFREEPCVPREITAAGLPVSPDGTGRRPRRFEIYFDLLCGPFFQGFYAFDGGDIPVREIAPRVRWTQRDPL
jgi:hypothetical protein